MGSLALALQIWLAARPGMVWGFIQPALWFAVAVWGNVLSHSGGPNPSLQSGVYGWGAIIMGTLSLIVFLAARWRLRR